MSLLVDYFYDEGSAVNKSWVCFGNSSMTCEYISLQQFNRDWQFAGLIEGSIFISVGLLVIPANILAIHNYSKKQMNKELLILIYSLCCYNLLNVPVIFIYGTARMLDNFPLSQFGCFMAVPFALAINNSTTLTLALISYERRQVLERFDDSNIRGSGLRKILLLILSINLFSFSMYTLVPFQLLEIVDIVSYPLHGENQPWVELCTAKNGKHSFAWEMAFSFSHFIFPLTVTAYNYCHIWWSSRRLEVQSSKARNSHRINMFFARLMIGSLFELFISHLPFDFVLYFTLLEKQTGKLRLHSTAIFISMIVIHADTVINPLWFSFVALVKQNKNGANITRLSIRLPKNNKNSNANFDIKTTQLTIQQVGFDQN